MEQPVPFSSISPSDHLAPLILWGGSQLCPCGPIVPASPWHTMQEEHDGESVLHSGSLRHFKGTVAALWNRGEPAPSLLLFNQSSAGWVKINDL